MPLDLDGLDGALRPEESGRVPDREPGSEIAPLPPPPPRGDESGIAERSPPPTRIEPATTVRPRRGAPIAVLVTGLAASIALGWWLRPREQLLPAATINTAIHSAPPIVAAAPSLAPPPTVPLDLVLPARFAFNHSTPHGDADALADIAARCLGEIVLVGHADWIGPERANHYVGEARAAAVRAIFVARGIDAARLRVESAGSHMPIAPNDSAAGRRQNRRVTLSCATNPGGIP